MHKASEVQHTESCSPLAMSSLMLPRSKLQSNRLGSPRNMHGNCFLISVGGDMLTCSIRNSVIKTVTGHRSLSFNRKAHWNHQSSTKFAGQTLDDNSHWFTWFTVHCSHKTVRTQTPFLPLNFFCSAITLHALRCCLLPDGCSNQLKSFDSFISALKRHKVLANKERKICPDSPKAEHAGFIGYTGHQCNMQGSQQSSTCTPG